MFKASIHRLTASAAALIASNNLAAGQGVPIVDWQLLKENLEIVSHQEKDLQIQSNKESTRHKLEEIKKEQLSVLEAILATTRMPESAQTMIQELEQGDGETPDAEEIYPAEDSNEAAPKLFGDAKVTVEEVIIQAAKDTHNRSGVGEAGLSLVQWRCLLQALIWQESRFNPHVESPVGAYGLTQIMPETAADLGIKSTYLGNPYVQAEGGARYLANMLNMFKGNIIHALAAYNAGPGNVQKYGGVPPFKETQHYVIVIPKKYSEYLTKIGGVEALGTIDPVLAAGAYKAIMSDDGRLYANIAHEEVKKAAKRIKSIVEQIDNTADETAAIALNAYARAEITRLLALRTRLKAAHTQSISAEKLEMAAATRKERDFMRFGE